MLSFNAKITVVTESNQSLECRPHFLTSWSESHPPVKTPKVPPKMEHNANHKPGL